MNRKGCGNMTNMEEEFFSTIFERRENAKPLIKKEFKDICDRIDKGMNKGDILDFYQRLAKEMLFVLVDDMEIIDMFIHIFE